jgi:hypothetical protein
VALRQAEWRDKARVAQVVAIEVRTPVGRAPVLAAALLLGCAAVERELLWWRRRRPLAAASHTIPTA